MKKLSKFNHNLTLMLLDRVQITHERTSIMPNQKKKKKKFNTKHISQLNETKSMNHTHTCLVV